MYTQGVDPELDCRDIERIKAVYEYSNEMTIPERHPYVGELVYTAFSGSHQDAINKGMKAIKVANHPVWEVPYLPIDPKDIGRSYEAVIRVNSQSGKGGVAYLMKNEHHLDLPRRLQIEFSQVIQAKTDSEGGEVLADEMWKIFVDEYLPAELTKDVAPWGRFKLLGMSERSEMDKDVQLTASIMDAGQRREIEGVGNGPISAFCGALAKLGVNLQVLDYYEHAMSAGGDAKAASYLECEIETAANAKAVYWGVGIDPSTTTASLKAIISAVNRALR